MVGLDVCLSTFLLLAQHLPSVIALRISRLHRHSPAFSYKLAGDVQCREPLRADELAEDELIFRPLGPSGILADLAPRFGARTAIKEAVGRGLFRTLLLC